MTCRCGIDERTRSGACAECGTPEPGRVARALRLVIYTTRDFRRTLARELVRHFVKGGR